jgi:ABC-2 type transport system permease protein
MSGVRQGWLVARRELRERSRSTAFVVSLVFMALTVAAVIALPALLASRDTTKDVGLTGIVPAELAATIRAQGQATGTTIRIHLYDNVVAGEQAVRDAKVDVLVVNAQQLDWRRRADEQLKAVVTGAIQVVAIRERATAAGVNPDDLLAMVAPVAVNNVELSQVSGRSADDETVAYVLTLVLFFAISFYGAQVLNGVIEEKSSRVVEVLLARMPSRNLLAGKIAGIGLLGLAQIAVTAVVALVAVAFATSVDLPAARGAVIAWAVVWFVLGYLLYATAFGTLGSLASRSEDAMTVTGPLMVALVLAYFASYAAIGSPDTTWARLVSWFPPTAPFAMPNRIAMGAATWWDPIIAVALTVVAIAGLVVLGGRVYTHAILHTGTTLKLRDAWRGTPDIGVAPAPSDVEIAATLTPAPSSRAEHPRKPSRLSTELVAALVALAVAAVILTATADAIIGIAGAAIAFAVASRMMKAREHAHR